MKRKIAVCCTIMLLISSQMTTLTSFSQAETVAPTSAPTAANTPIPASIVQPLSTNPEIPPTAPERTVSLDFRRADLESILKLFSQQSGMNVIASEEVKEKKVTIFLDRVTPKDALESIIQATGLGYEPLADGKVFVVREPVAREEAVKEVKTETQVYVLNHASLAKEEKGRQSGIVDVLSRMVSEYGYIAADERTNSLVIKEAPEKFEEIERMIKKLDSPTPQVMIEAKVIETSLGKNENLGIEWTTKITATSAGRPHTFPFNQEGDHTFGVGGMNKYLPLGQSSSTAGAVSGSGTGSFTTSSPFSASNLPIFPYGGTEAFTFGTLNFTQFSAIMEILKSRRDTQILSNPRVTTLNDKEATILVGETLGVPKFERNETTGKFEITGYEEKDLGVKLAVTPHVNEEGDIVVILKPEISSLLGYDDLTSEVKAPKYSTREAETQVRIRDGQTIAIGGLIKDKDIKYERKIPILGDIPILGYLFKKTEDTKDKTELLIFVTVHLVKEGGISEAELTAVHKQSELARDEAARKIGMPSREEEIGTAIKEAKLVGEPMLQPVQKEAAVAREKEIGKAIEEIKTTKGE